LRQIISSPVTLIFGQRSTQYDRRINELHGIIILRDLSPEKITFLLIAITIITMLDERRWLLE
jgi:hypothetical protein